MSWLPRSFDSLDARISVSQSRHSIPMTRYSALDLSRRTHQWLCPVVAAILLVPAPALAQQEPQPLQPTTQAPAVQPMAQLPVTQSLRIIPLAGNNEQNDLQRGVMAPLVVQVLDGNGRPVEGARVIFRFPASGPSAFYEGMKLSQSTMTNSDGQAAATGWTANKQVGKFNVKVNASRGNETGEATITMINSTTVEPGAKAGAKKGILSSKWAKIGIIAAIGGGILAAVLLTRDGGGSSSPTVTATPGTPTIGGGR